MNETPNFPELKEGAYTASELSDFPPIFIIRTALQNGISPWWSIFKGQSKDQQAEEAARFLCRKVFKYTGRDSHHNYVIYYDNVANQWTTKMAAKWMQQCYVDSNTLHSAIASNLDSKDTRVSQQHWEPYNPYTHIHMQPRPFRQLSYGTSINTFRASNIFPETGCVDIFLEHLLYLCDENEANADYALKWMAWKVQNPSEKLRCAMFLGSENEGTGKSMFIDCFLDVLGRHNGSTTDLTKALGDKTDFLYQKLLVVIEEIKSMTPKQANKLKALITNDSISHDRKFKNTLANEPNYADFILTSNYSDAIHVSEGARRYFVIHSKAMPKEPEYYERFMNWKDNGGIEALAHFLSNYSLEGFSKDAPPPITDAFRNAVDSSRSEAESLLLEHLREESTAVTVSMVRDLLPKTYRYSSRLSDKAISKALIRLGYTKGGRKTIKGAGKPTIYYKASKITELEGWKEIEESLKYGFGGYA